MKYPGFVGVQWKVTGEAKINRVETSYSPVGDVIVKIITG